ncbi:MAG: HEAT repeat domain-containing protein [Opitutales bacterium]
MKNSKTLIAIICALGVGFLVGHLYHAWNFKYKAFGEQIKYGNLYPEYAYAELIADKNKSARDAALQRIVKDGMESRKVIISALDAEFGSKGLDEISPMAALAMHQFDLSRYLKHSDPQQRAAAVFASRWWKHAGKVEILKEFLNDSEKIVIDQTIYELGYIGESSVLATLEESRFDDNAFIAEVRKSLESGVQFR